MRGLEDLRPILADGGVALLEKHEVWRRRPLVPGMRSVLSSVRDATRARMAVAQWLRAVGMGVELVEDAVLCVGEATSNVVRHAGYGWLEMHVLDGGRVQAWVGDEGPGIEPHVLPQSVLEPGWSSAGSAGQGFTLMRALSRGMLLATDPTGTVVVMELGRVGGEQPPAQAVEVR